MRFPVSLATALYTTTVVAQSTWTVTSQDWSAATTGSVSFSVASSSGGLQASCSGSWAPPTLPTTWAPCSNSAVRWHFRTNSTQTIEVAYAVVGQQSDNWTITLTNITLPLSSSTISTQTFTLTADTNVATLSPFQLSALQTYSASDVSLPDGSTGCETAQAFVIINPNVPDLGLLTSGHGSIAAASWRTTCQQQWYTCSVTSISGFNGTACAAPAFTYSVDIPTGGNVVSDFVLGIEHTFPVMMMKAFGGTPDLQLTNPEEAGGFDVVVTGSAAVQNGGALAPMPIGTGQCGVGEGCWYAENGSPDVPVTAVEIP